MTLDQTEDRWRTMKTNPVVKSEQGWQSFREKTASGKFKRPAFVFRSNVRSRYQRTR